MIGIPEHAQKPDDILTVEILWEGGGFVRVPYGRRSEEDDGFKWKVGVWGSGEDDEHSYLEGLYQSDRYSGLLFAFDDVEIVALSAYFVSSNRS